MLDLMCYCKSANDTLPLQYIQESFYCAPQVFLNKFYPN